MNTYRTTVLAKLTAPIEQVQHALVPYSGTISYMADQEAEITVTIQAPDYPIAVITGCAKIVETHLVEKLRHKNTSPILKETCGINKLPQTATKLIYNSTNGKENMSDNQLPKITDPANIQQLVDWATAYGVNPEPLINSGTVNIDGTEIELNENRAMLWINYPAQGSGLFFEVNDKNDGTWITPVYEESFGPWTKNVYSEDMLHDAVFEFINNYPRDLQSI